MYLGLKGGILNIADYDPLGYELSCCGSVLLGFLNLVQSYFGHTVDGQSDTSANVFNYFPLNTAQCAEDESNKVASPRENIVTA